MFFDPDIDAIRTNCDPRHGQHYWHAHSEEFASTSQFLSVIVDGWQVSSIVIRKRYSLSGGRCNSIYYFELQKAGRYMTMPVLQTPTIVRFIVTNPFQMQEYGQLQLMKQQPRVSQTNQRASVG